MMYIYIAISPSFLLLQGMGDDTIDTQSQLWGISGQHFIYNF